MRRIYSKWRLTLATQDIKLSNRVFQDPVYFIAFGLGSGLLPLAPGTWGTLIAIPIYLLFAKFSLPIYLACTIAALLLGIWVSEKVSKDLKVHDHPGIVWDEVVGYFITMIGAPVGWVWMVIGFLLFRLFDVWKPQPIRFVDDNLGGGLGIMMDDVLAAVPAWLILQLLVWIFK